VNGDLRREPTSTPPLVSIVTPTLQCAAFLEETLRSVQAQSYPRVEHIVIDGGSTDGTLDLLRSYASRYNLRWSSEPDGGMYDAINKGLHTTAGEIIAYVNSDDRYFPWSVETAVAAFAAHPEADFIFGDIIRIDGIRGVTVPIFVPPYRAAPTAASGTLSQPAVFMRRRVLESMGGFDDRLRYVADLEFWLRAGRIFRFVRVPEFLALEHRHGDMLSEASAAKMAAEDVRVRNEYRSGFWATDVGRFVAYVRRQWWSGHLWLDFCMAAAGSAEGWRRTIEACGPQVSPLAAVFGWLPSKGSRLRSRVRWHRLPLDVAADDVDS